MTCFVADSHLAPLFAPGFWRGGRGWDEGLRTAIYEWDDGVILAYCSKKTRNLDRTRITFVPFGALGDKSACR